MVNEFRDPVYVDCDQATWNDVYNLLTERTDLDEGDIHRWITENPKDAIATCKLFNSPWFDDLDTQDLEGEI